MSKCPICNKELVRAYEYGSEYGLEEYKDECPGHYTEVFNYGSTQIEIGDFITGHHYTDTPERKEALYKRIQLIADSYKEEAGDE